jgi:TolA-binding protein
MSDPVRLLELGSDDFEAQLLRAGRSDAMPAKSRRQILAGLGIGGLLGASTVTSGVRAAAKGWFAKTTVGAAAGALAIWAGVQATHSTPPTPAAPPAAAPAVQQTTGVRPAAPPAAEVPTASEPEAAPEVPRASIPVRAAPAERNEGSLTQELAALEQARRAFLAHDYTQSLKSLDEYARRFPKRQLGSEATVLRIETLSARGDREAAARIGREFLRNHANGPYAKRVRTVIGEGSSGAHP